jgi:hypothetical protein
MNDSALEQSSLSRLAQIIPIVRGLLAESTGEQDIPYKPVILKSLTSNEAIDFAGSAKNAEIQRYPAPLVKDEKPPMFLDAEVEDVDLDKLRKKVSGAINRMSSWLRNTLY